MRISRRKLLSSVVAGSGLAVLSKTGFAQSAGTVKLGLVNSLTGPGAFGGVPEKQGMELAIKHAIEAKLTGAVNVEVLSRDDASEKGQTITIVNRFIKSDNVHMILGADSSALGTAVSPICNDLKTPIFNIGSSKALLEAGPYSFKVQASGDDIMGECAKYAVEKLGTKKMSIVFDRTNDGFISQKDAFKKFVAERGVKTLSEDGILPSDTDFLALASKIASLDIDTFFVAVPCEVGANILLQIRQAGVPAKVRFVGPSTFSSDAFVQIAGDAANDAIICSDYYPGDKNELNVKFVKAYADAYGRTPDNWAAMGYALGALAMKAISKAGANPTRDSIKDAMAKLRNEPTVIGNHVWTMDDKRNPHYGVAVLTVANQKFVLAT